VTWFTLGDLSTDRTTDYDYLFEPPENADEVMTGIALVGLALVVAFLPRVRAAWTGTDRLRILVRTAGIGFLTGGAARVITRGDIGANLGGAYAVVLWVLLVPVLAWRLFRTSKRSTI
jgi:hypothetical protein